MQLWLLLLPGAAFHLQAILDVFGLAAQEEWLCRQKRGDALAEIHRWHECVLGLRVPSLPVDLKGLDRRLGKLQQPLYLRGSLCVRALVGQ